MSEVKDLIKKRGAFKGRLTTFINHVNSLPATLSSIHISELHLRISKMDQLFNQFDEIQTEIECLAEEKDASVHFAERQEFEKQYYAILAKAQLLVEPPKPKYEDDERSSSGHTVVEHKLSGRRGIKLPTIQVPKFDGRYEDWLEFRDTFVSLIHENEFITDIQKFHYLRASLQGGATQVIRSLEFTSSNYPVAWDLVCDRYNNTRLLIQNHVQSLFSMEPMRRESFQSIRTMIDTYTKNLRSLELLGEPTTSWDTLIIHLITTKLDAKSLRDWEEEKKRYKKQITLQDFTKFLKDKADLLEAIYNRTNTTTQIDNNQKNKSSFVKGLAVGTVESTSQPFNCPLCNKDHRIYGCDTFLSQSVDERAESVRRLKLCMNCLRPGHLARFCRSSSCTKCSRPHNTLLHKDASMQSSQGNFAYQAYYAQDAYQVQDAYHAQDAYQEQDAYHAHPAYQAHTAYQAHPAYQAHTAYQVQPAYQAQSAYEAQPAYQAQPVYQAQSNASQAYQAQSTASHVKNKATYTCPTQVPQAYRAQTHTPPAQVHVSNQNKQIHAPVDNNATSLSVNLPAQVLLSTAVVYVHDKYNNKHEARAVLDSGSQASFMTEALLNKLKLKCSHAQTSVVGINNAVSQITKRCNTQIESRTSPYKTRISFLVLPNIANLCNNSVKIQKLNVPPQITLADPEYYDPSNIDILLGADIFWDLIDQGQIRLGAHSPVLQNTKLGYIVSGPTSGLNEKYTHTNDSITCNLVRNDQLDIQEQLTKFWALEQTPNNEKHDYSTEERLCEEHFAQNFTRMLDGRFSVAIPLKMPESCLGDSYEIAKQCFLSLERRLQKMEKLKQMYTEFIQEYKDLNHMTRVHPHTHDSNAQHAYYLPHHGVLRESSTTTKLRVVFNASKPTSTGISLNDLQMIGPTIQSNLFSILIRFRHYPYVMTGDIEKMYRQVLIHHDQRHLQRIIWRDDPKRELEVYQLNTVTYGTASAPFLAIRCLKQLALECTDPNISQIIKEDFYVDDLVTGCESKEKMIEIRDHVSTVLSSGCFNLRKIRSNIDDFTGEEIDSNTSLNLGQQHSANTLGIGWSSSEDELYFSPKLTHTNTNPTKRSVLSTIGQIFDPLGLLSVFVISAKIILQKLWLHKLSWDEPLPSEITKLWYKFTSQLCHLQILRLPRYISCVNSHLTELHTFCDSSQDAYGACVYVRSISDDNNIQTLLLCAKSKVAPLKPVTIPRLELCGAVVAARLTHKVLQAFRLPVDRCILWTDSSIVLGWLKTAPNKLKQFVKNRVAEVQELTQNHQWRHVPTQMNPADLLTRGVDMTQIQNLELWWNGPSFLNKDQDQWPSFSFDQDKNTDNLPEVVSHIAISDKDKFNKLVDFNRFPKLHKLRRSFAYALRFIHNCRSCKQDQSKYTGHLSKRELDTAFNQLIKQSQIESFEEYSTIKNKQDLPTKDKLLHLSPFTDEEGLIRVGGRLKNSQFEYNIKHPILISCKHPITKLIFAEEHTRLVHAAPQLLLSSVRQQYWPLGGRNMARHVVHKCHRCFRMKAQTVNPIMGQLPGCRLNPGYPFETTGVDYAGPLLAADRRGRGCKLIKVYVAVFVCFTTKALHLELVSELTKDAYIAALRRFIARRSKPSVMFSDNGTQFVGAKNEIGSFLKQNSAKLAESMANESIDFRFIPAYAPHFGGLWEAGVKSFKGHLSRVLGNAHLNFEELYTVLVQIEAILNSRPLTAISPDPHDLNPLTPGHFLVGRPLTALPSPRLEDVNPNRLQRWERVEQLRQHFWTRWQKEYVSELQQKVKWRTSKGSLEKGTMVIIKEDAVPPMKWSLGRVIAVYPGSDGISRVADIQTNKGVIKRAFNRICPLPVEEAHDNTMQS